MLTSCPHNKHHNPMRGGRCRHLAWPPRSPPYLLGGTQRGRSLTWTRHHPHARSGHADTRHECVCMCTVCCTRAHTCERRPPVCRVAEAGVGAGGQQHLGHVATVRAVGPGRPPECLAGNNATQEPRARAGLSLGQRTDAGKTHDATGPTDSPP